jgi:hypothetical protein
MDYHQYIAILLQQSKQLQQLKSPMIFRRGDKVAPNMGFFPIIACVV